MGGSSRIGGTGAYGGYGGMAGRQGRSASLERFKRNRKVGDVVSGVFLRLETESLGWALLEGEELLAHLPAEGPQPKERETVFFRVESLAPEVVLRMLPASHPLARLSLVLPPAPLSQEAGLYIAARDKLDSLLATAQTTAQTTGGLAAPSLTQNAFIDAVAGDPGMLSAFAESMARSRALERAAAPAGLVFFRHMPWLCPTVSSLEVSLWSKGESPVFAGCVLPSGDKMLLRGSLENGSLRYRVSVIPASSGSAAPPDWRGSPGYKRPAAPKEMADVLGRILAQAFRVGGVAMGRFSRTL
ncbi:MAG: hypothetical protein DELT_00905 [Desulfovibrio sp.]